MKAGVPRHVRAGQGMAQQASMERCGASRIGGDRYGRRYGVRNVQAWLGRLGEMQARIGEEWSERVLRGIASSGAAGADWNRETRRGTSALDEARQATHGRTR